MVGERYRDGVPDCAVGSVLIVEPASSLHLLARIRKGQKPVRGQARLAELRVERLDVRVVRGLARPGEVQRDAMLVSPGIQITRDELASVASGRSNRWWSGDLPQFLVRALWPLAQEAGTRVFCACCGLANYH